MNILQHEYIIQLIAQYVDNMPALAMRTVCSAWLAAVNNMIYKRIVIGTGAKLRVLLLFKFIKIIILFTVDLSSIKSVLRFPSFINAYYTVANPLMELDDNLVKYKGILFLDTYFHKIDITQYHHYIDYSSDVSTVNTFRHNVLCKSNELVIYANKVYITSDIVHIESLTANKIIIALKLEWMVYDNNWQCEDLVVELYNKNSFLIIIEEGVSTNTITLKNNTNGQVHVALMYRSKIYSKIISAADKFKYAIE